MGALAEWTFEADPNYSRRRRGPGPVIRPACIVAMCGESGRLANLSGTAIGIEFLPPQILLQDGI